MKINELAEQLGVDKNGLANVAKDIGIKNDIIADTMLVKLFGRYIKSKESMLHKFKDKLKEDNDKLDTDKAKFEAAQKSKENTLKEKLLQEEIKHGTELEKLKIKTITKLKDEFLENIKSECDEIHSKLDELTQRDLKLGEWQQDLDRNKATFVQDKEIFESEKDRMLSEHEQWIEAQKDIFINEQEKVKVEKLEEINQKIEDLYSDKEKGIVEKEAEMEKEKADLKTKQAELLAKEKYLESQSEAIYTQEKEKVSEELKNLQSKVDNFEKANDQLREELSDKQQELDDYEKFEDRDLPRELENKQQEVIRINKQLEDETKIKNDLLTKISNKEKDYEREKISYEDKANELLKENKEVKSLKSQIAILEDEKSSNLKNIEFLQGENKDVNDRLNSIYSDGTEIEERIKDIKEKPYKKITLDSQLNITDEVEYLDSIRQGMEE